MKLSDHQFEFLKDFALLVLFATQKGYKVTAGELWRPDEMQRIYVEQGKSKTYEGKHTKRCAGDLNLFIDGEYQTGTEAYQELGDFWESLNFWNRWGGNFTTIKDGNHFERNI